MSTNFSTAETTPPDDSRSSGVPRLLQNGNLRDFEQELRDRTNPQDLSSLVQTEFPEVTDEHLKFLIEHGGARKLREFYYEVLKFDLTNGTQTSQYISADLFRKMAQEQPHLFANAVNVQHTVRHRSALTSAIEDGFWTAVKLIEGYGFNPEDATVFDEGCGAGKPALIAASRKFDLPFKRAVGIDNYGPILNTAGQNKKALNIPSGRITFAFADAAKFTGYDGLSVAWIYNPFDEEILEQVRQRIEDNAKRAVVIYNKPRHPEVFTNKDAVKAGWKKEQFEHGHADPDPWTEDKRTIFFTFNMDR